MTLAEAIAAASRTTQVPPLMDWIPMCTPGYSRPEHLKLFIDALEGIHRGPLRILCSVAPRHGKTDSLQRWFIWLLKQDPRTKILYLTHTHQFAQFIGRNVRRLAIDMGVQISDDSSAKDDWATTSGGGLTSAGVDSDIIGRGWHVVAFDDPYKNSEAADSEVQRETIQSLWTDTVQSRIDPHPNQLLFPGAGSRVVNAARWHHADLIGVLEKDPSWKTINLPAILPSGEPLWPAQKTLASLLQQKHDMSARAWAAQYMGQPSLEAGGIFQRAWFGKRYQALPWCDFTLLSVDGAWKEGAANDWTVVQHWGVNRELCQYYAIDQWRAKVQLPDLIEKLKAMTLGVKPDAVVIEDAASGIAAIQMLQRAGIAGVSDRVVPFHVGGISKEARAERVSPMLAAGSCFFPAQAHWVGDLIEEAAQFPTGAHDDMVDSMSMALWQMQDPMTKRRQQALRAPNIYAR